MNISYHHRRADALIDKEVQKALRDMQAISNRLEALANDIPYGGVGQAAREASREIAYRARNLEILNQRKVYR